MLKRDKRQNFKKKCAVDTKNTTFTYKFSAVFDVVSYNLRSVRAPNYSRLQEDRRIRHTSRFHYPMG